MTDNNAELVQEDKEFSDDFKTAYSDKFQLMPIPWSTTSHASGAWWGWQAALANRTATTEPGEVVVTKDSSGAIVAVTRQDADGKILSVIAESTHPDTVPRSELDAAQARIDEREACAKECDEFAAQFAIQAKEGDTSGASDHMENAAIQCAEAIRARSYEAME